MPVSESVWEAIESRIIIEKDKSRFWFFFLLPFFLSPILLLQNIDYFNTERTKVVDIPESIRSLAALDIHSTDADNIPILQASVAKISKVATSERSATKLPATDPSPELNQTFLIPEFVDQESENEEIYSNTVSVSKPDQILKSNARTPSSTSTIKGSVRAKEMLDPYFSEYTNTGSECPDFEIYHPGFYAYTELVSGVSLLTLKARKAEFVDYKESRELTESNAFSYSATLGLGFQFDNGLIAESGISFDRLNTRFKYKDENAIKNSTVITIDTMILNDIDTIIHSDTIVLQQTGINEVSIYNNFNQIDIPLVIGFEFPVGEKFRLSLKGGVMINITSSNSGQMLGLNNFPIAYGSSQQGDSEYFKTNIGFSYTGGINLEADINENISLYAGANLRYYPNSFSLKDNPISQRYTKVGLTTGIKYRL